MLFRKHIVSTRTLFQLTVALVFFVAAVGAAVAAGPNNAPLLVPYTLTTVAGTPQYSFGTTPAIIAGYGGDIGYQGSAGYAVPFLTTVNGVNTVTPGATMSGPYGFAVDSVGDVYIADKGNDLIREVNYSTGLINIVAGVTPGSCKATPFTLNSYSSCTANLGCADGVPAYQAKIGSGTTGIAVDAYGNVYFTDSTSSSASVVYRGGTQVAAFIALVNPAGVANSGGSAKVGYVYHIAGEMSLSTCAGQTSNGGFVIDNAPAFENTAAPGAILGATLSAPTQITLDSAGNIYIADINNHTTRVINTQATDQTFFQYTVHPGYMRSISDCNSALTVACADAGNAGTTSAVGTGINGPANGLVYNSQNTYMGADAYGNVYQLNGTGSGTAPPGIYDNALYAGGAPLTNLLTVEAPTLSAIYSATETAFPVPTATAKTPNELPLTYGNGYLVMSNPTLTSSLPSGFLNVLVSTNNEFAIRTVSFKPDSFGTFYYFDSHFQEISRVDQYTSDGILLFSDWAGHVRPQTTVTGLNTVTNLKADGVTVTNSSNYNQPASLGVSSSPSSGPALNPWNCIFGTSTNPWKFGPQTYDPLGDGCPGMLGAASSTTGTSDGNYYTDNDGLGNLYFGNHFNNLIREMPLGTQFPATAVGTATPVTQPIQVHFDVTNPPFTGGGTQGSFSSVSVPDGPSLGFTTNAFSIAAGSDFSINTTTPEYPLGSLFQLSGAWGFTSQTTNFAMYPVQGSTGFPTCAQLGVSSPDNSWDCLVYVTFNPTGPGMRTGQLQATTSNGSVYNFQLTGMGTGGQLAIDGGQQQAVATSAANGLGTLSSIAVTSTGTGYIADPTNNRIVVEPAGGGAQTVIGGTGVSIAITNIVNGLTTSAGVVQTLLNPMGVAVDAANNVYIADTGNNRILEYNPNTKTAAVLGNYLWIPGSTCDGGTIPAAADCVFQGFSTQAPGSTTIINSFGPGGTSTKVSILNEPGASVTATTAPPQYKFKGPQGLAVDQWDNVYVADTGNSVIVEIPSDTKLGGATPLFQYPGAPTFTTPVAVAVDSKGFIYVADQQNPAGQIVRIPPGGGDLQPSGPTSALSVRTSLPLFGGQGINTPNGVAVDAAGNVYVSDSTGNAVWEAPAVGPPSGNPFTLSFTGLSAPAGLALDAKGNLYVADSGNKQVLFMNRVSPTVPFGTVPQGLTSASGVAGTPTGCPVLGGNSPCTGVLTVSNIGNSPVTVLPQTGSTPFLALTGPGSAVFSVTTAGHLTTCASGPMPVGTTCTISPLFTPSTNGSNTATVSVNGTQSLGLTAQGVNPEVGIVLTPSNGTGTSPNYTSTAAPETITATVNQPHTSTPTPTGTVTFTYAIDAGTANAGLCGATVTSAAIPLVVSGSTATATYVLPTLLQGLVYTVSAVYTPAGTDTTDSTTNATPIVLKVAGISETVTATSVTYTYGQPVPPITGTVVPAPATGVTYSFIGVSNTGIVASAFSAIGVYPVQVVFTGGTANAFCSYGFPPATNLAGAATVTEKAAPLSVLVPAYTTVYGAATFNYASGMVVTGAVGTDLKKLSATFSPADSSVLDVNPASPAVNPFPVIATITGKPQGNYTITYTSGTDTITPAPAGIAITAAKTSVLDTTAGLASATYTISVGSLVPAGKGTPTGTISVTDNFVPITSTVFIPTPVTGTFQVINGAITWPSTDVVIPPCATGQTSTAAIPCNTVVTLSAGAGTFTLPATEATTTGTHYLSFAYSGDATGVVGGDSKGDFACSVVGQLATASCPTTNPIPYALIVDNPDFTLTSTTGPITVIPGNVPSGNGLPALPNQDSSNKQSAILTIGGVLAFGGTVAPGSQVDLNCVTQNPSYVDCFIGQPIVVNGATQLVQYATILNGASVAVIFDVSTPPTLPLGFSTSQMRTSATRTVLAFLPFGVLAFCVRRRRRLSKALWMMIAIAAVSVGMSGCGGNQVDFFTPIPTGPQTVTVIASYKFVSSLPTQPAVTRSLVIPININ